MFVICDCPYLFWFCVFLLALFFVLKVKPDFRESAVCFRGHLALLK